MTDRTRGQAFTLEGFVASAFLLTALLFAHQSLVLSPSTGGTVDAETQTQLRQQAQDVLLAASNADSRDLSWTVRHWNPDRALFVGADSRTAGYGNGKDVPGELGGLLVTVFGEQGRSYNVVMVARNTTSDKPPVRERIVWRGPPGQTAVTASYRLTLYDNMTLTGDQAPITELRTYSASDTGANNGYYPIPNVADGPVYNVVEVRLTVW
ncbi:hypothetical protein C440_13889 [Haloferax mucosum ATCC BAA-1512]|uniref:Uncharacterized protein n=1 Tax=Haloferax mucosum ATCC BAA-1512 TaxID=662479 RepID=M0I3N3_9EURY|nr:hypothetical protein [Haloferax mucosum]ELZ91410.1 hypothetical protein C440_13889 [Haloferax mucosum ATCC BAA-1512]